MRRPFTAMAILLLSGGLALAQGGAAGSSTTGPMNPNGAGTANPGPAPAPSGSTVGQAPGVNSSNPQDLTNRSNPQDLAKPGGGNPQDLKR